MDAINDSIVSDSQTGVSFHFAEHDNMTYRCIHGTEQPDLDNYVLNFVLDIKYQVQGSATEEGGCVVQLRFPGGTYLSFVPSSAWKSSQKFFDSLRKNSSNLPAIFPKISGLELIDYGSQKTNAFDSHLMTVKDVKHKLKKRVKRMGYQRDSDVFVLGPDVAFSRRDGVVQRIDVDECEFVWIPGRLTPLEYPMDLPRSDSAGDEIFRKMAEVIPEPTLASFCINVGAVLMGIQYQSVTRCFKKCPVVVCVGDSHTGKSLCSSKCMDLIALEASRFLEYKNISAAALRSMVFGSLNLPVLLHDPYHPEVLKVLAEETYEIKAVANSRERLIPGSSGIITCNPDYLAKFRDLKQMRGMSRCVIVPYDHEVTDLAASDILELQKLLPVFASQLLNLLAFCDEDIQDISQIMDEIAPELKAGLDRYKLRESVSRISFNIAMVYAFSLKALRLMNVTVVDLESLKQFVLNDMTKASVKWQTPPLSTRKGAPIPLAPLSPSKKSGDPKTSVETVSEVFHNLINVLGADANKLKSSLYMFVNKNGVSCLAVWESGIKQLLRDCKKDVAVFANFRLSLPVDIAQQRTLNTRFPSAPNASEVYRKTCHVPVSLMSENVQELVRNIVRGYTTPVGEEGTSGARVVCPDSTVDAVSVERTPNVGLSEVALSCASVSGQATYRHQSPPYLQACGSKDVELVDADLTPTGTTTMSRQTMSKPAPATKTVHVPPKKIKKIVTKNAKSIDVATKRRHDEIETTALTDETLNARQLRSRKIQGGSQMPLSSFSPTINTVEKVFCQSCFKALDGVAKTIECVRCAGKYHLICQKIGSKKVKSLRMDTWRCLLCAGSE